MYLVQLTVCIMRTAEICVVTSFVAFQQVCPLGTCPTGLGQAVPQSPFLSLLVLWLCKTGSLWQMMGLQAAKAAVQGTPAPAFLLGSLSGGLQRAMFVTTSPSLGELVHGWPACLHMTEWQFPIASCA